jgi:putative membrane protein
MFGYYGHMNAFGPFGLGISLGGILFWVALIFLFILLLRSTRRQEWKSEHHSSALDILKERYAKGEITKKEFDIMKKDINQD